LITFKRTTREVDLSDLWSFNLYSAYVRYIRHLTAAVGGLCKPCSPPQQLYRARQKSNPLRKILYLWNCSRYIYKICRVYRWGFSLHILQILLK